MSAFFRAIRLLAIVSASVTVGRSPSGTFATMMPMAKIKLPRPPLPIATLTAKKSTPKKIAIPLMTRMKWCSSRRMGVSTSPVSLVS